MNKIILLILVIGGILFFSLYYEKKQLEIYFLDVGQGDAILIRSPQGQNILIDGGPDNQLLSELGQVLPWWERQIDYVIVSHYHDDHLTGLIELLNKYKIKNVLVTAHQPDDFLYQVWADKLLAKNIKPTVVKAGDSFVASDGLSWQVILADSEHEDYNENSLVIRLTYHNKSFLLTGDLGKVGEDKILSAGLAIDADYLKVGHHGSKYSSSAEFLEVVSPEICIIQSGKDNKFGHPHLETLKRLSAVGCQIMNTQDLGTISFNF
ncbi:MAG: hypothetical protein A2406_01685 [Candidatus Komeilibacteria bacterium RIFOXYC1_FULL_37_11]|uniref:Metallo-beta-lactamase domain-containing protein n=1 Tax=Candidatus Komeilibacteria bacterium RIFOXYC1_FULL_37_11 TaxID=1798555 RepID=A0A1G2BZ34_9BACT|nr:MAG: hypothetical protein A2406_01685 [Candidatus Komeilibacteria bacterium RIFOXYC1_FULL_37_11]OGY95335.1 MAG: hypothetical protein A2611_01390 [Candidatus Komeilibacteria bacterium RIFOXYD1_FULL_37_29]OGY96174.1 MAG: hypothetical protein A2543_01700 [Candidatus Komeilibacteria bacterium RIFOXYD2_FULL_37_8]